MTNSFQIGNRIIGPSNPTLIIAEVGLAHDGSLGFAHAFIDAASQAGVDAIKFQTHIADSESSPLEEFRVNIFPQDLTRYDYWLRTSFSSDQWKELKSHADDKGLLFLSSPFSLQAVHLLRGIGIEAWKIGSGEANNLLLLEEIANGKEPIFLSSGMSYLEEIDQAVKFLNQQAVPVMLMQCTSRYPCPPEKYGLDMIQKYSKQFNIPVGFSDHSGELSPCIAAVSLGASAIEVHVTWSKSCFGPDVQASLTFDQLSQLVHGIRLIERSFASPVDKDTMADSMSDMRQLFTKGLVANTNLKSGTKIERTHLEAKKPCLGIPVFQYKTILGKAINRSISSGESIDWQDIVW